MKRIIKEYDRLQKIYGSKDLNSVYGCGKQKQPKIALVFMNPTKRNIATDKSWSGLRAQWLGTKQIWKFLAKCGIFSDEIAAEIGKKKASEWTPQFCDYIYKEVEKQELWITNLAKCTQDDARPLPDDVFIKYKDLLKKELDIIKPKKIFFFGNQVSSIMLQQSISVSQVRRNKFNLKINNTNYESYAIYYPVGNGRFNQTKAIEDIKEILSN